MEPLFLHLVNETYKGLVLDEEVEQKRELHRMVPPG